MPVSHHAIVGLFARTDHLVAVAAALRQCLVLGTVLGGMFARRYGQQLGVPHCQGRRGVVRSVDVMFDHFGVRRDAPAGQVAGGQYHCGERMDALYGHGSRGPVASAVGNDCQCPGAHFGVDRFSVHSLL